MKHQILNLLNAMFTDPNGVGEKTLTEVKFVLYRSDDISPLLTEKILANIVETNNRFYFKDMKFMKF